MMNRHGYAVWMAGDDGIVRFNADEALRNDLNELMGISCKIKEADANAQCKKKKKKWGRKTREKKGRENVVLSIRGRDQFGV